MAGSIWPRPDRRRDGWELRGFLGPDESSRARHQSPVFDGSRRIVELDLAQLDAEHDLAPGAMPDQASPLGGPATTINDAMPTWRASG